MMLTGWGRSIESASARFSASAYHMYLFIGAVPQEIGYGFERADVQRAMSACFPQHLVGHCRYFIIRTDAGELPVYTPLLLIMWIGQAITCASDCLIKPALIRPIGFGRSVH